MNNSYQTNVRASSARHNASNRLRTFAKRMSAKFCAGMCVALCGLVLLSGCRQPVTSPQSTRSTLFDFSRSKLFGGAASGNNGGYNSGSYNNGGFSGSQYANNPRQQQPYQGNQQAPETGYQQQNQQQYAQNANELQRMNQRLGAYDSDNQLLNTEVASLKQKLQLANQYNQTLKGQLGDTSNRIQLSEMEKQAALQQLASVQMQYQQSSRLASNAQSQNGFNQGQANSGQNQSQNRLAGFSGGSAPTQFGGATLRANNSLMQKLSAIRIPGGQARMDGDVIRIEFPSDRMFVPSTYQVQPAQLPVLQNIAATIRSSFPKNIIGIEAHWDGTPLNPSTTTHHQLTATQSLSVFDNLVRLGLPKTQLFTMAMASNRPRHPQGMNNGVSPNRRIELVIYPETYDGSY